MLHKHSGDTSEYRPELIALKLRAAGLHDIALEAGVDLFVQVGANLDPLLLAMRFFKLLLRPKVRIISSGRLVPALVESSSRALDPHRSKATGSGQAVPLVSFLLVCPQPIREDKA